MSSTTLFDFTDADSSDASDWRIINDVVMGGVSQSRFVETTEGAAFTGTVSLDQGGGFASVRAPESMRDLSAYGGLRMQLRGDGKQYWLTTYTEPGGPISYRARIEPSETWMTLDVPFSTLSPYRRGTQRPDAPPFAANQFRTLGFLIADRQAGPFRLEIARIQAVEMTS